jgi:glucose dehydrogenase
MPDHVGCIAVAARTALLGVSLAALVASAQAAEYKMTVNRDRLVNSANEPQNWLMMNGDYGATRYSKLAQINRDNVKNLRMVWAMPERPRERGQSLNRQRLHVYERRLGHGVQDRRAQR